MITKELFNTATLHEPLSKDEQLTEWLKFDKAMKLLGEFYRNNPSLCCNVKLVKHFGFLSPTLIELFYKHTDNAKLKNIVKRGLKAKDTLIITNLRMIIGLSEKYIKPGIELEFLVQEATTGAIRALVKFQPTSTHTKPKSIQLSLLSQAAPEPERKEVRTYKVSSYMHDWIKCYLRNAVSPENQVIKSPSKSAGYQFISLDYTQLSDEDLNPEIDFSALVKQKPEQLEILELSDMELALERGISVTEATKMRDKVKNDILKYLAN